MQSRSEGVQVARVNKSVVTLAPFTFGGFSAARVAGFLAEIQGAGGTPDARIMMDLDGNLTCDVLHAPPKF